MINSQVPSAQRSEFPRFLRQIGALLANVGYLVAKKLMQELASLADIVSLNNHGTDTNPHLIPFFINLLRVITMDVQF